MKKNTIWIASACILLGVVISFQMKYIQGTYLDGSTVIQKADEVFTELSEVRAEKNQLLLEIERLQVQLADIQDSASQENVIIKNLTDELNRYKAFTGLTPVSGPGVMITIDNPPHEANLTLEKSIAQDYMLIVELINELNSARVEAVSINEQRVVNQTEIRLAATRQMNVNGVPLSPPYVIKAVGDPQTLHGAVTQRFGIIQKIREMGYYVEIRQVQTMDVPAFNGTFEFIHASVPE